LHIIYWTYKHFIGEEFEGHDQYGSHCVVALAPIKPCGCSCLTGDEDGRIHNAFYTRDEAINFIIQLNKPQYNKEFGTSYELQYLESDSNEWYEVHALWKDFLSWLSDMKEYFELPWYKRLYRRTRAFLKGKPVLNLPPKRSSTSD